MTDWLMWSLAAIAGMALGTFFFGGLWWTVRHGLTTRHPALVFSGSLLLRVAVVVGGFYLVGGDDWRRLLVCLAGFLLARWLVTRWTRRQAAGEDLAGESGVELSPDTTILWQVGWFKLNATIAFTWAVMALLVGGSWLVTSRLSSGERRSRWQNLLEIVVIQIEKQVEEVGLERPREHLGFLGTLFLFIAVSALCTMIPGYQAPTGSLSTTTALALSVFVAVPFYGVVEQGLGSYLRSYARPTPIMLPFNVISEFSRTLALAVRLFGNMMSGAMIIGILLTITPFLFPIVLTALGLLTGMVQAYIFFILATVYIAAATRVHRTVPGD